MRISHDWSSSSCCKYLLRLVAVDGALTCCALLHSVSNLMDVQRSLMLKLMLCEFELGHNTVEATKNVRCMKGEGAVDLTPVKRQIKKFCSGCKNLDEKTRPGKGKTVDSEVMFQTTEVNSVSNTRRVSAEYGILQSSVVCHLHNLGKGIQNCWFGFHVHPKYCKTFESPGR